MHHVPWLSQDILVYECNFRLIIISPLFHSPHCPNLGFKICGHLNPKVRMSRLKSYTHCILFAWQITPSFLSFHCYKMDIICAIYK